MANHKAKHDIFLDVTRTRVVRGGHATAGFLVAREGDEVPEHLAALHGIIDGAVVTDAAPGATMPDLSTPRNNVAPEGAPRRGRPPGKPSDA